MTKSKIDALLKSPQPKTKRAMKARLKRIRAEVQAYLKRNQFRK